MKTTLIKSALILGLICFLNPGNLAAQENQTMESNDYSNAIGLRLGGTSGLTYKHRFVSNNAVEVILGTYPYSYGLTGLYERYAPTTVSGLNLYFGGGAHISRAYYKSWGYYTTDDNRYYYYKTYNYGPIFGFDLIGGIEYKIPKVPLAVSVDLKPYLDFFQYSHSYVYLDPSLGIKFTF
jgi:hypothetical protein